MRPLRTLWRLLTSTARRKRLIAARDARLNARIAKAPRVTFAGHDEAKAREKFTQAQRQAAQRRAKSAKALQAIKANAQPAATVTTFPKRSAR